MKRIVLLLLVAVAAMSCQRVPLYDAESGVYLRIDLSIKATIDVPEELRANLPADLKAKADGRVPERMQVNFYDVETHALVTKAFVGAEGGYIDVAPGVYDIVVYSMDCDVTRVDKPESRGSFYAYTAVEGNRVVPMSKANGDAAQAPVSYPVILEPDHLYVGRKENVVIPAHSSADDVIEIHVDASTMIETYIFRAHNVKGIENAASIKAYITGQARARGIWDLRYINGQAIIGTTCYADRAAGEIYTVFNTFGKFPNADNQVFLNIEVTNSSGERQEYVFDVTDQFDNPDNTNHEIDVDDEINVPKPGGGSGGGFQPDIDDWDDEHTDIDI